MLAISRGLMSRPEDAAAWTSRAWAWRRCWCARWPQTILDLNAQGVTVLLVEQMASMALAVADRAYVIQNGLVRLEGPSQDVASNPEVVRAYLGGAASHD